MHTFMEYEVTGTKICLTRSTNKYIIKMKCESEMIIKGTKAQPATTDY